MPPSRSNPQSKGFTFTLNNYTDEEYQRILCFLRGSAEYFIVGKEVGDSGTPHLQGYCYQLRRYQISSLKNQLSQRCHIEVARGTSPDNRVYCSKGNDYVEGGTNPGRGQAQAVRKNRDQLALEWRSAMERGRPGLAEFADANPGVYAWSRHTLLRNSLGDARAVSRPDISVTWLWGPPGVGKSRSAHASLPDAYIKEPRTKWWNGYMLETTCIIDDFGDGGIDINHLLRWFDRYKCYVEVKGDMCPLNVRMFIVTSNFHPSSLYKKAKYITGEGNIEEDHPQMPALIRRLNIIYYGDGEIIRERDQEERNVEAARELFN